MLKILIADDHAIVRAGLKQVLADTPDMTVTDEAGATEEAIRKALDGDFDVVVLDISMPGRGGLEVLQQIKSQKPKLPVLVLSMHPEEQYALRVLKAGAAGYLTKESVTEELIDAIRKVSNGMKYVSPDLAQEIAFALDSDTERPIEETLSDREFQVLCMIASGKTPSEIAEELSLSVKTVSTYRSRILEKMRMKSNAELTNYAIKNNLVV
jgi:DNA-binding NarL/FixJ family response regulator